MELEELVDALELGGGDALVRPGEGLEPPEVRGVGGGGRGGRERLGVGRGGVFLSPLFVVVAGLREELGILLEDLQVLLFYAGCFRQW